MLLHGWFQLRGVLGSTSAQGCPEQPRWHVGLGVSRSPWEGTGMEGSAPLKAPGQRSRKQQHSEPALMVTG